MLRRHRLVESERRGSQVYYRLAVPETAELLRVARRLLAAVLESARDQLDLSAVLPDLPELPGPAVLAGPTGAAVLPDLPQLKAQTEAPDLPDSSRRRSR